MKIVLCTFGSRGDVQPMLALSLALLDAGHDACLAGPPEKAAWAAELGCPYRPLGSDLTAFIDSVDRADSLLAAARFIRFVRREIDGQFDQLPPLIEKADLVVGASLCFALSSVAEAMAVPYRYIAFSPQLLPSRRHPFPALPYQGLPDRLNRLSWQARHWSDRLNLTLLVNRRRPRLGLKPIDDCWEHVLGPRTIVASDRALAGIPADAAGRAVQTGYMHLRQPRREAAALTEFLQEGPPPVYAGFGSMPTSDQERLVPLIVAAVRWAGRRAVINRFGPGVPEMAAEADVLYLRGFPHGQLFPRMAAVIHHGGAGTTATAAASGVPQVVVPHLLDQHYWGQRVYLAGLGPRPIRRSRLTAGRLALAVTRCLTSAAIRRNASRTGAQISQSDGVRSTSAEILLAPQAAPL